MAGRPATEDSSLPAWQRETEGEPRWPMVLLVVLAIALQVVLPAQLSIRPRWLLPALEVALLLGVTIANPGQVRGGTRLIRGTGMALVAAVSLANAWSAGVLIHGLVRGTEGQQAGPLLVSGASIWVTNVIAFALWYWELDRGGSGSRAQARRPHPDFAFPQMVSPKLAADDWEPRLLDYLYLSFTNASAFSPTDVMPLSRWAKMLMLARSVNILPTTGT